MAVQNGTRRRARRSGWAFRGVVWPLVMLAALGRAGADELPPAGGLEALPKRRAVAVGLANGGFEDGANGWRLAASGPFQVIGSAARTGKASLGFDAAIPFKYTPSVRQAIPDVRPGVYRLRFHVKTEGIKKPERGTAGVRVSIEYQLAGGDRRWAATQVFQGTADWRAIELSALLPRGVKGSTAAVSIHRYNRPPGGKAYFDDFSLHRISDPPVEAYLLQPNYRGYLSEDGPQKVRLWVKVHDTKAPGPARVEVTDAATGKKVASVIVSAGKKEQTVELAAAKWPAGRYMIRTKLGDYAYPAYVVQKISAAPRRRLAVWFDENNVLYLRGKAVFPLGLYVTSGYSNDAEAYLRGHLRKMSEAPVNFVINYWMGRAPSEAHAAYFAAQRQLGVSYLVTVNNFYPGRYGKDSPVLKELVPEAKGLLATQRHADAFTERYAKSLRSHANLGGWYVMDERPFGQVRWHFHQYQVLRRADPDHPTYGVSNRPDELHKWRDALDVFGLDPYPLFNMKLGRPLTMAGQWTRTGAEATMHSRPVWMCLQFFQGWSADRWPTEEELRTMSLMAVTEGARGLFYWSFGARALMWVKDAKKKERYWGTLVRVMKELKSLEPALLAPDARGIVSAVSDPRIRWRARRAGGKSYVFAYLPARKFSERTEGKPVDVTFTLSDGRTVRHTFRPDTAHWFACLAGKSRSAKYD